MCCKVSSAFNIFCCLLNVMSSSLIRRHMRILLSVVFFITFFFFVFRFGKLFSLYSLQMCVFACVCLDLLLLLFLLLLLLFCVCFDIYASTGRCLLFYQTYSYILLLWTGFTSHSFYIYTIYNFAAPTNHLHHPQQTCSQATITTTLHNMYSRAGQYKLQIVSNEKFLLSSIIFGVQGPTNFKVL